MFLNLRNGRLSIDHFRTHGAEYTTVEEVLDNANIKNKVMSAMIVGEYQWKELKFLTNRVR